MSSRTKTPPACGVYRSRKQPKWPARRSAEEGTA